MREALNFNMIPIVKDAMDGMVYNASNEMTNFPSNGYYGYQPHLDSKHKQQSQQNEAMEYENYSPVQPEPAQNNVLRLVNRKRVWEYNDTARFKKRRQNEDVPLIPDQSPCQQNALHLKKPTHNIPDIPRCIMGHYI